MATHRSFDEEARIASAAFERLALYRIPPTPENFTVWYHYFADSYPDLKRAIDVLLKPADAVVSAPDSAGLFERFFANAQENESVRGAFQRFEDVMRRAADDLTSAGEGAAAFGNALADASGALATGGNAGMLQIVQGIVRASRQMEARSKELEDRLAAASSEVTQLKDEVEAMRVEATTDALTGLANRKKFDTTLREACEESEETGEPLSLLMLDLDHFKRFNDEHGHLIGDQVLRLLGEVVSQCIKGRDTAARYGGEEFAVILPSTSLANAQNLGNAIRERIAKKKIINRVTGRELGTITLSIGAGQYRLGEPVTEVIARADAALYRAKRAGRNRVMSELDGGTRVAV